MSRPVDVLAVMDGVAALFPTFALIDGLAYSQHDMRRARALVAELMGAAHLVSGRIEHASKCTHDSTRWSEEVMYDDTGITIEEWITEPLYAALAKCAGAE